MISDRRGEAHLWLLLEEALLEIRRGDVEPWEAWRNFRAVTDALVVVGALASEVGEALVGELDDALAVRGVVPAASFSGGRWPELDVLTRPRPAAPAGAAGVWLEAEVERHLDLFVSFGSDARPWAATDLLRILGGPVRAFAAVGLLGEGEATVLDEVAATLAEVGTDAGRAIATGASPRTAWVEFLRARPAPLPEPHEPSERRLPRLPLGSVDGAHLRLDAVSWSAEAVDLELTVRRPRPAAAVDRFPWHARILDDQGRLHLGQSVALRPAGVLRFALRPGLERDVHRIDVRVTRGGERVEASVAL